MFEGELRQAQGHLQHVWLSHWEKDLPTTVVQSIKQLDTNILLAHLLTSQNILPSRLLELAPRDSYKSVCILTR